MPSTSTEQNLLQPTAQYYKNEPSAMQIDQLSEEDESSEDELQVNQTTTVQSNKKRTLEQRSPQKNPQKPVVEDAAVPLQRARWNYLISKGIQAFQEALRAVQGQNAAVEEATRELLLQAKAVQQGKVESALVATKELAKEIQALKEHVLKATNTSTNTPANTTEQVKTTRKSYTDALKSQISSQQSNKPLNTTRVTAHQHRKDKKKRELVLLVEEANSAEAEAVDPLVQRNAINAALQAVSNSAAVVANVRLTTKKNLILTTTETFSADFLLQHKDTWKSEVQVTCKGMQTQEEWIQVVAHGVYMHEGFISSTADLKAEIETFNNIAIKGNPRWLAKPEKLKSAHLLPPHQRYGSIVFVVGSEDERQRLLAQRQLSIAGRVAYLAKYHEFSAKTQCQRCYKLGHTREICRGKGCKLCAEPHLTKDHASCLECKTMGRLCKHQKPCCVNCKGEHTATSRICPLLNNTSTSTGTSTSPISLLC